MFAASILSANDIVLLSFSSTNQVDCPERSRSLSIERLCVALRDMTQLDPSPHRGTESSWMDERRCRSRRVSGTITDIHCTLKLIISKRVASLDVWRTTLILTLTSGSNDFQSPEETGNTRVATSLQKEEVMVSGRWRKSTNGGIVTTKGGIHFRATMFVSPKPASHTGMLTSACPRRGGTQRRTCRTLGEVNRRRDTRTTPTLDKELIHRGIHQHVTAL